MVKSGECYCVCYCAQQTVVKEQSPNEGGEKEDLAHSLGTGNFVVQFWGEFFGWRGVQRSCQQWGLEEVN